MKARIQKVLSERGICSRRKAESYIKKGWIKINGQPITDPAHKIDPEIDEITLSEEIKQEQNSYHYLAFHKPEGIITNCPQGNEKEIKDLLPETYKNCHAIGRLDKDSEGLILLTNDGIFAKNCLQGEHPHSRIYKVWLNHPITESQLKKLSKPMTLFGKKTNPIQIKQLDRQTLRLTLIEGKNRQIRRLVQKIGLQVTRLKRLSFGDIELKDLKKGDLRALTQTEVNAISQKSNSHA